MKKAAGNLLKIAIAISMLFILTFPAQGDLWMAGGPVQKSMEEDNIAHDEKLIELTEEEVSRMNLFDEPPTRSEPWNQWERYSYHRGGEMGLIAYQESENRVFIYGGGSASWSNQQNYWSYSAYDDLFIFDFDDEKWYAIELAYGPSGRFGFGYAVDEANERFLIYGGFEGSMRDDLWEFDMNTLQWNQISSGLFGTVYQRRGYVPMVLDTTGGVEHLYIHMGMKDDQYSYYNDNLTGFYRIDLQNPTGTPTILNDGTSAPTNLLPRYQHSMTIDEDGRKIYLYGGNYMNGSANVYLNDFWAYDIVSNTWTQLTTDPLMPLNYGARIFFRNSDDRVYLWGGRETENGLGENETLWVFDPVLGSWDRWDYDDVGVDVPDGRLLYHHHYSSLGDKFFVFAGRHYEPGWGGNPSAERYRDLSYMTLASKAWTLFPLTYNADTNSQGVFAYESSANRLHYVGPNTASGVGYTWYWDLAEDRWYGRNYNQGTEDPDSRYDAGIAYDEANNTAYFYGGQYTSGWGNNRRYYNRADMWKIDLTTNVWEKVWDTAGPGERHGFDMVFNPNDGKYYFYGGRRYISPGTSDSDSEAFSDFYAYIPGPTGGIFQAVTPLGGETPGKRYGAGFTFVPELNKFYLCGGRDPNPTSVKDYRDLWEFDMNTMRWKELDGITSPILFPKLDFDPLTRELYLTGGDDYIIRRYRILEDAWYSMDPDVNPESMSGQAHIFIPETRDLWVYGGGSKPGIWKIGMPYRLAIQNIYFANPYSGSRLAYAMYEPYTFGTVVKTVNSPSDLSEVEFSFLHRKGNYRVIYNSTEDSWIEVDNGDHAEIVDTSVNWVGNFLTAEVSVMFHWNFTSRPNDIDKKLSISVKGVEVEPDFLEVKNFLNVKNRVELVGDLTVTAEKQGGIIQNDWVRTEEEMNFMGPLVKYAGSDVHPPADSYTLLLSEGKYTPNNDGILLTEVYRTWEVQKTAGEPMNHTFNAYNRTTSPIYYVLNLTGVNEEDLDITRYFNFSVDGTSPASPSSCVLHADSAVDTSTNFDNDFEVYLTWMDSGVSESGLLTSYWSFEDGGGTRDGTPISGNEAIIELPSNGTHTVWVWTEDVVGNIGPAISADITIDNEIPEFRVVSPDLEQFIPYREINIKVNVTDRGGSLLNSQTLQYRLTNDGLNSETMWTGSNAWKDLSAFWTDFPKSNMDFNIPIGGTLETIQIPKLSDTEENFLQFRIVDFADNDVESEVYNIRVDTDLRFPKVTLFGPEDGEIFDDVEDIYLNWTLDFFLPEDVTYKLFISKDRDLVETLDLSVMTDVYDTSYEPIWINENGKYYWLVVPVARNTFWGNSTNGIKSFSYLNLGQNDFNVTGPQSKLVRESGIMGIPINFQIRNEGTNTATVNFAYDIAGIGSLSWLGDKDSIELAPNEPAKEVKALLDISPSAPVGNYTLTFYFNSSAGINKVVEVQLQVVAADEDTGERDEGTDYTIYIIMAAVLVVLILIIISVVYFMVLKKSDDKGIPEDTSELDELEDEIGSMGGGTGYGLAPQPAAIKQKPVTGGKLAKDPSVDGEVPPGQEAPVEGEEEALSLAEDGSEDDWMNLVAKETVALESESEVEEDKTRHDEGKSLADLLGEMSSGVQDDD